jgi:hypothetical protein
VSQGLSRAQTAARKGTGREANERLRGVIAAPVLRVSPEAMLWPWTSRA